MKKEADNEPKPGQTQNMKYSEERLQLLDTIRDMVNEEFDRRRQEEGSTYLKNPIPAPTEPKPPEKMPPRCTAWQRLAHLFNIDGRSHGKEDEPLDIPDK